MKSSVAGTSPTATHEPVWPATVTILIVFLIALATPNRYILGPRWLGLVSLFVLLALFAFSAAGDWFRLPHRYQRAIIFAVICIITVLNCLSLAKLIALLVLHAEYITGARLLTSSIFIWIGNYIEFAMLYWLIDGGGPDARIASYRRVDFQFPQPSSPDAIDPAWRPNFMDYVFLGFTTATAFSPTDTLPLTTRARVLMMIEALVSLLTIAIAAARAVNILT